jgi:hypothetical protein
MNKPHIHNINTMRKIALKARKQAIKKARKNKAITRGIQG